MKETNYRGPPRDWIEEKIMPAIQQLPATNLSLQLAFHRHIILGRILMCSNDR